MVVQYSDTVGSMVVQYSGTVYGGGTVVQYSTMVTHYQPKQSCIKADSQYDANTAVNAHEWQVQGALCKFCI